jgi:hypothetical protein
MRSAPMNAMAIAGPHLWLSIFMSPHRGDATPAIWGGDSVIA